MLSHRQREVMNAAMLRYAADPDAPCTRPLEYALRSLARMERARFDDAAADARLATGAKLARVAGHLLFACGYFGEGLDRIADADTPSARSLRARLSAKMGWTLDALDAIHEALDKGDAAPALYREAAFIHAGARDDDHAYSFARRALDLLAEGQLPDDHDLTLLVAKVAPPAARTFALEALSKLPPAAQETSLRLALAYRRLGADPDAVTHLERCAASTDLGLADEARALLALIAFEDGDDVATRRWATAVRDFEGRGRVAECVLGALALMDGDDAEAERILVRAAKSGEEPLVVTWLAEVYLRQGRFDEARALLHRARLDSAEGFSGPLVIQRLALSVRTRERHRSLGAQRFREVDALLRFYTDNGRVDAAVRDGTPAAAAALTSDALTAMGRRRSVAPIGLRTSGSRRQLRRAIEKIRVLGDASVEAFLREAEACAWDDALGDAHHGELLLWLGRDGEAEARLRASIAADRQTRWPYIGLSALALVRGEAEEALWLNAEGVAAMDNTVGGSVHVHRGEALRILGRFEESKTELLRALQLHPSRLSGALNLALLAEQTGDASLAETMWRRIEHQASGLLSDAGRQLRARTGQDPTRGQVLAESLRMFGANRSSTCMSYLTTTPRGAKRRFVGSIRPDSVCASTMARQERGRLRASLGLRETPAHSSSSPHSSPVSSPDSLLSSPATALVHALSEDSLEEFVERGYCVLRGAFSAETAQRWTRAAAERIASFPDLYVKGYGPNSPPLWEFDEDDAETWSWERIDLLASSRGASPITFEEFSPSLWHAIVQVAGPNVATTEMSDYFRLNLRENRGVVRTPTDARGWHVDDPGPAMSLTSLRNGLVLVMVFSDCEQGQGGTYLLEGSVGVVARHLATHPSGVDLSDVGFTESLAASLPSFHQVHGRAGDVYLCSSLLLHTSSPNPSGKIRWMANPMIHLKTAPSLDGQTPLERGLLRALTASAT